MFLYSEISEQCYSLISVSCKKKKRVYYEKNKIWDLCSSGVVNLYQCFRTIQEDSWPLKMGPTVCPEMSVKNCHYVLCNFPKEHRSHLLCDTNLKLRKNKICTIRTEALIILFINVYWVVLKMGHTRYHGHKTPSLKTTKTEYLK